MARRYTRDNRGRFASTGSGATARGGRLKTAAGNKRATQTMKAQGVGGAGVMKGKPRPTSSQSQNKPKLEVGAKPASRRGTGRKVDVQIQRAKAGGQYGPDGHWYPAGAWMSQGKFVGGQPAKGIGSVAASADQKGKPNGGGVSVIRNKAPQPKPLRPSGQGLPAQPKMTKNAKKLNDQFFGASGFLSSDLEKSFRAAGSRGRAPIDNTRYIGALAGRVAGSDLRAKTLAAVRKLDKAGRRGYIRSVQDARRDLPYNKSAIPRVGASDKQLLNAIRFDTAAREIAGRRAARKRPNSRTVNEEYAFVTNALLMKSRRRK